MYSNRDGCCMRLPNDTVIVKKVENSKAEFHFGFLAPRNQSPLEGRDTVEGGF